MSTSNLRRWLLAAAAMILTSPAFAQVASVSVAPANASINVGSNFNFSASAIDASGLPQPGVVYAWSSSDPVVATVNASGQAQGLAPGEATIFATAPNGVQGTATLRVSAVVLPPPSDFHVNEIHYDNVGVDNGETMEDRRPGRHRGRRAIIVVLYNGNGGAPYNTQTLSGLDPGELRCARRPDGELPRGRHPERPARRRRASSSATGVVLEFISYEGVFTATSARPPATRRATSARSRRMRRWARRCSATAANVWTPGAITLRRLQPGSRRRPAATSLTFSGREAAIRRCRWATRTSSSRRCAARPT